MKEPNWLARSYGPLTGTFLLLVLNTMQLKELLGTSKNLHIEGVSDLQGEYTHYGILRRQKSSTQ